MSDYISIDATIDKLKEDLRQISDDTVYSDEYLYAKLLDARNILIWRNVNKKRHRPKFIYKTFCMPLEKSKDIPCDCLPQSVGCTVLKSKYKLPRYMVSEGGDLLHILSANGDREWSVKDPRVGKYNKYTRTGTIKPYAAIMDDYLYIIGYPDNKLKGTLIELVPEDPSSLDDINLCEGKCNEGNITTETCYDPLVDTFNLEGHLVQPLIEMAMESIAGKTMKLPEDRTNTTESTPKEVTI